MNLDNLKKSGIGSIYVNDSLNASLLSINIKPDENATIPDTNDLFVYVDIADMNNQTNQRKQYLFDLSAPLRAYQGVEDEFDMRIEFEENEAFLKGEVIRKVGVSNNELYLLTNPVVEEVESFPITLFSGINYIYTNYSNAIIELMYPKDTEVNRMFLNNAIYYGHKLKKDGEFTLDDIYFKDAFTKTEDKLNLEVNNSNVECLTSKNNKFSLDSEGNLIVNSITANSINSDDIVSDHLLSSMPTNIAGDITLTEEASIMEINNLDALNEGGIYDFIAIGYTNSNNQTDLSIKINNQNTGYHHCYMNATGSQSTNGSLSTNFNYVQDSNDINEFLQANGSINSYPVVVEGRLYISENASNQKRVNYSLRHYRSVANGQSICLLGGVFSQSFENINSLSISLTNSSIKFSKGSRLIVFNPLKGVKGDRGDIGPVGPSNSISIGTVTHGDEASATITGDSPNQVLNLVLPRGEAGGTMTVSDVQNMIEQRLGTIYPVGSIYMSVSGTNPGTLFGGVWESIEGQFLIGVGSHTDDNNETWQFSSGQAHGEYKHQLTISEMPSHSHSQYVTANSGNSGIRRDYNQDGNCERYPQCDTGLTGGNGAHNNMPPYLAVYMWKRVS